MKPTQTKKAVAVNSGKKKKTAATDLPTCRGCMKIVTQDALQCDRCESDTAWKCIDCLGISKEAYEVLSAESSGLTALKWYCDSCEKAIEAMETPEGPGVGGGGKLDEVVKLLEKVVDRLSGIEDRLSEKADVSQLQSLERRIAAVETDLSTRAGEMAARRGGGAGGKSRGGRGGEDEGGGGDQEIGDGCGEKAAGRGQRDGAEKE